MRVKLSGGQMYVTEEDKQILRVENGEVLVYILPLKDGSLGRRFKIHEATVGEEIPTLCWDDEKLGAWRYGLVAIDHAELSIETPQSWDEARMDFAKRVGVRLFEPDEFGEQMADIYDLNIVKEEAYIYATSKEQAQSYEQGLNIIYSLFDRNKNRKKREEPKDNRLYDAVTYLCDHMDISVVSYENLKDSCKRKYDIQDIARLSHFATRQIVLEEDWYTRDSGPVLAYMEKGRAPIACIPKGNHSYIAFDPKTQKSRIVTKKFAEKLAINADMLYRPFPAIKITLGSLMKFGLKSAYMSDIVSLVLLALLGTVVGLLLPMINQQLYDTYIPLADASGLVSICILMLCISLGNLSFTIVKNLATFRSMNAMEYAVQSATYDRLFNMPESFFRKYDSSELAQRAMGITSIFQVCADVAVKTALTAAFSLLYLWRMVKYAKLLVMPSVVMVVLVMILIGFIGYRQVRYEEGKMEMDAKAASVMYQFLTGISKIRIAGIENRALVEYLKPYAQSRKIEMKKAKMDKAVSTIVGAANICFTIVMYYIMVRKSATVSVGAFMGFSTAFGSFSGAMLEVVSSFLTINMVIPAYKRCKPVLEGLPEYEEDTVLPGDLLGDIEVSNVNFAYDKEVGNVLQNLSFQIKAGEYVGVVGASGCGKSTLLKLLLGFEKPSQGKIFYDGRDIDSMDKRELRKKLGVVLQDGNLISGSIYENITITAPGTTMEQVEKVVEAVGLKEDIEAMPMGLHTVLSENCGTISGGQRQRILIARAIVNKPRIIFFDEATSALDNVTQSMVCNSLEQLRATRMVIAHRLSTVINCDRILVMDAGRLVEQGNYQELMEKKGLFYQLASRQLA